jgi:hypothetical protein
VGLAAPVATLETFRETNEALVVSAHVLAAGRGLRAGLACGVLEGDAMHDFTPFSAWTGGALMGAAASILLLGSGRISRLSPRSLLATGMPSARLVAWIGGIS